MNLLQVFLYFRANYLVAWGCLTLGVTDGVPSKDDPLSLGGSRLFYAPVSERIGTAVKQQS